MIGKQLKAAFDINSRPEILIASPHLCRVKVG
jgi:hypothetical protein